jgi:hypothetical protein
MHFDSIAAVPLRAPWARHSPFFQRRRKKQPIAFAAGHSPRPGSPSQFQICLAAHKSINKPRRQLEQYSSDRQQNTCRDEPERDCA